MIKNVINWFLFFLGLTIMSLGISLVTHADLGTTPISALPLVTSYISGLSFGTTTLFINLLLILIQWFILRRKANWTLALQLPVTFGFALLIDFWMSSSEFLIVDNYVKSMSLSMLGNVILALGVALEVFAGVMVLPGEGVVVAFCYLLKKPFPKMKIANDVLLVTLTLLCSFCFFGELRGLREGTVISALTVGFFVKLWLSLIRKTGWNADNVKD